MEAWEYKTVQFATKGLTGGILDLEAFEQELNTLGSQGWELVSCFDTNQSYGQSRYVISVLKKRR